MHAGERGRGGGSRIEDAHLLSNFFVIFQNFQLSVAVSLCRCSGGLIDPAAVCRHPLLLPLACLYIIMIKKYFNEGQHLL